MNFNLLELLKIKLSKISQLYEFYLFYKTINYINFQYIILSIFSIFVILTIVFIYKKSKKNFLHHLNFKKIIEFIESSCCIVNSRGKIIFINDIFQRNFRNINLQDNFLLHFKIKQKFNYLETEYNDQLWRISKIPLKGKIFGIIFTPAKALEINWWKELPFPIVVVDKYGFINNANIQAIEILKDKFIGKELKNWATKFNLKEACDIHGQEIVWHSEKQFIPMLIWAKPYNDKFLIFLEKREEFIQLRNQAQEAQHLQTLGQFAGSIVHDFNNLITAIGGFTELLESSHNDIVCEIQRNIDQASNLAKQLLQFVKVKSDEHSVISVSKLLNDMEMMLRRVLTEKVKFNLITNDLNLNETNIALSETQFEQIILNLALNSRDAMKDGGILSIQLKDFYIKSKQILSNFTLEVGEYLILELKDTGEGISEDNINKIFSPFFSTKANGTGLGLTSSIRLMHQIGGAITVKSILGEGTTFNLYLPKIDLEKEAIEESNKSNIQLDSKNIDDSNNIQNSNINKTAKTLLIAEDEENILKLVSQALEKKGFIVHSCSNGKAAHEILMNNKYKIDALITDAFLPDLDGLKLTNIAREINPNLAILIISGYSTEDLISHVPKDIFFLPKPFTLKSLYEKINQILNESGE